MRARAIVGFVSLLLGGLVPLFGQSGSPIQYVYDDLGRLIQVIDQNGNSAKYSYDSVGNLLSIIDPELTEHA